jgi:hypothetical protein
MEKLKPELPPRRGYAQRAKSGGPDLVIVLRDHCYSLQLFEEKVPLRGVWEDEERWRKNDPYHRQFGIEPRIGRYDKEGTARLTISLDGYSREGRQASWGDRRSWTLEEKLPDILREIEVRSVEDDYRAEEQRRKEEERQRQWELAMERAKERFVESYRGKALRAYLAAWQEAKELSTYLVALEHAHGDDPDAAEWIEWVRRHIERLNPLNQPQTLPTPEEIRAEDLKPFLGGLELESQ